MASAGLRTRQERQFYSDRNYKASAEKRRAKGSQNRLAHFANAGGPPPDPAAEKRKAKKAAAAAFRASLAEWEEEEDEDEDEDEAEGPPPVRLLLRVAEDGGRVTAALNVDDAAG